MSQSLDVTKTAVALPHCSESTKESITGWCIFGSEVWLESWQNDGTSYMQEKYTGRGASSGRFVQKVGEISFFFEGSATQVSTMWYAKALPRDFRFLPGLHGARRTGASQPMQKQHGTRDEGNTTHTLHARRVVFRCRLFLPLALSISFINSYLPDGDYPPRPRRGKNCGCSRSRHNHNNHVPTARDDA